MPVRVIDRPTVVEAAGNMPKQIEEFVGVVNSDTSSVSIARMTSPAGWSEPAQTPEFDEYTVVLNGVLVVETENARYEVGPGQAIIAPAGERVQYSTPGQGAEYFAICLPAFTPGAAHRD